MEKNTAWRAYIRRVPRRFKMQMGMSGKVGKMNGEHTIYIQMLGDFRMTYDGKEVLHGKNINGKVLELLLMLIYFRKSGIQRDRLLAELYGEIDDNLAANSLRVVLYRLRRTLEAAGLPDGNYVTKKGGLYRWDSLGAEILVDTELFQRQAVAALEENDLAERVNLLEEALRYYRGDFLPMMIVDGWIAEASRKYRQLCFQCMRELADLLKAQRDYTKLLSYCDKALSRYPYEEWQLIKLECLEATRDYQGVLQFYKQVENGYRKEFGMRPPERLERHYRAVKNIIQYEMEELGEIQCYLRSGEDIPGGTQCDFPVFTDIYHYMERVFERMGISAGLVMFTLTDRALVEDPELLEELLPKLETAISSSIRRSDLYTQYGKNKFLVLLVGSDEKGWEKVCGRIQKKFSARESCFEAGLEYTYRLVRQAPQPKKK